MDSSLGEKKNLTLFVITEYLKKKSYANIAKFQPAGKKNR